MRRIWLQGLTFSLLVHAGILAGAWLWSLIDASAVPQIPPIQARLVAPEGSSAPAPPPEKREPEPEQAKTEKPEPEPEPEPESSKPEVTAQARVDSEKPKKPELKKPRRPDPKKRVAEAEAPEEPTPEDSAEKAEEPDPPPDTDESAEEPEPILSGDVARRIERLAKTEGDRQPSLRHRKARDRFVSAVRSRIQANWLVPPGLEDRPDLKATVRIALTPAGRLAAPPKIVASSGPGYFNSSVVRAVEKAAPFPMPEGPTSYFQHFKLNFSPDMIR